MELKTKSNRCRDHKSNWGSIRVGEIEYKLDEKGRLKDKFPKHKPRKYLSDSKTYQNDPSPAVGPNPSPNIVVDSSQNVPNLHQEFEFDYFNDDFDSDNDCSPDFFTSFELDDQAFI